MRVHRSLEWVIILLFLLGAVGWIVYRGYDLGMKASWGRKSNALEERFGHSLVDKEMQLSILAEGLAERIRDPAKDPLPPDALKVAKRLGVSEIIVHTQGFSRALYSKSQPVEPGIWRATIFDFFRTTVPQLGIEKTEYGPRLVDIEPFFVDGRICGVEVSMDLQNFLTDFSRREGVEMVYVSPCQSPIDSPKGLEMKGYKVLCATSPAALEVLRHPEIGKYLGARACGMMVDRKSALAVLALSRVEYSSEFVPSVGNPSTLILSEDCTATLSSLVTQRRWILEVAWGLIAAIWGLAFYFVVYYRRHWKGHATTLKDSLNAVNESLKMETMARQHAEERLRGIASEIYAEKETTQAFLMRIAHHIKLNASASLGFIDIAKNEKGSVDTDENMDVLRQLGEDLLATAENMEIWLRRGRFEGAMKDVPLQEMINRALGTLAPAIRRKSAVVTVLVESSLWVRAEPLLLETALKNLISNALKYSTPRSTIEISGRQLEKGIELSISDNGRGISQEVMEKIFEPPGTQYERGSEGKEGLGLGIFVVREICEFHRAQLRIASDEGQGCRVTLLFPLSGR